MTFMCQWYYCSYHARQGHFQLRAHAVQAFEDTLLPASLCKTTHKHLAARRLNGYNNKGGGGGQRKNKESEE